MRADLKGSFDGLDMAAGAIAAQVIYVSAGVDQIRDLVRRLDQRLAVEQSDKLASSGPWNPREHVLPAPAAGPRFGREDDIAAVVGYVCQDAPRPVIVLGGPGMGKSTLARNVLHEPDVERLRFDWRRYWVDCETTTDRIGLVAAIARVIGLQASPDTEPGVYFELSQAPALLVLDNLETPLAGDSLGTCDLLSRIAAISGVAIVATRRGNESPGDLRCRRHALDPLDIEPAREALATIAGAHLLADPRLNDLLNAVDRVPLAITLLAHLACDDLDLGEIGAHQVAERAHRNGEANEGQGSTHQPECLDRDLDRAA